MPTCYPFEKKKIYFIYLWDPYVKHTSLFVKKKNIYGYICIDKGCKNIEMSRVDHNRFFRFIMFSFFFVCLSFFLKTRKKVCFFMLGTHFFSSSSSRSRTKQIMLLQI